MLLAVLLIYVNLNVANYRKKKENKKLECYLQATVLWMLILFLITEIYSFWHGLHVAALRITWLSMDAFLLGCYLYQRKVIGKANINVFPNIHNFLAEWSHRILAAIGVVSIVLATATVPYNWDSMTYRLPRIAYWAQNGSIEHYATSSMRMIANPPLGEFIQLHVYLMHGEGDLFLTWIQCAAYLTCAGVVYGIAKKIDCDRLFSFLATLLFMSMPIAFGEALNTQVDLLATLWLLVFTYFLLDFIYEKKTIIWSGDNRFKVFIMGLCVTWGYLTKPSVCVAMVVLCLWLLINCIIRKDNISVLLKLAGTAFAGMAATIVWELTRNIKTFHAFSSPLAGARQLIGTLHPGYVFVNALKNLIHNLPSAYLSEINTMFESLMRIISNLLHVDLNAECISEGGGAFRLNLELAYGHDTALNPIIVWLMLICILWGTVNLIRHRKAAGKWYQNYMIAVTTAFLVFCCVLRWEPYVTRYMLSFLALLCPGIAVCLQQFTVDKKQLQKGIIGLVIGLCLLDTMNMAVYHRNLCVRLDAGKKPEGYFAIRPQEYQPCMEICQYILDNGYSDLGIFQSGDDYEYPYWSMLHSRIKRIEHVNMYDESAVYSDKSYQPECIIWLGALPGEVFEWNGQSYRVGFQAKDYRYVLIAQ